MIASRQQISNALRRYQISLRLGAERPSLAELAARAGIHRDTLYQALHGRRISPATQARLSVALNAISNPEESSPRLMHVRIGPNGPKLGFGIGPVGAVRR